VVQVLEDEIMPRMPNTLQRSSERARHLYTTVLENAEKQYGPGERASRTAMAALKHSFEKRGDHWEEKKRPGPSDPRALQKSSAAKRDGEGETYGGVDAIANTRAALYIRAKDLNIRGRSSMTKAELACAISVHQD
jgi:hypothetical protein